jgi:homoserine O-acetyltransferase
MNVCALGGISAHKTIAGPEGWWSELAGIGKALDPTQIRLIGIDWLESGASGIRGVSEIRGANAATTADPDEEIVTTAGQADHLARQLDAEGIDRLDLLLGSSFGGNVALCFAARHPERVARLVIIGAAHRPHPMATALRSLQRRVVLLGLETGRGRDALEIARGIAMTTYRTAEEFAGRFDTRPDLTGAFPVESYLEHQGTRYATRNTPERFLELSLALDLHEVAPGAITTPAQLIAFEGDAIAPPWQMAELRDQLGGPAELAVLPSLYGHDAFLKESEAYVALLRSQVLEISR